MAATTAYRNAILGLVDTGHYIGLIATVTNELAGTVTEVSVASYARQAITWTSPASGEMENDGDIVFPATAGDEDYTHVGLWSASSGGTLMFVWAIGSTKTYDASTTPTIPSGNLTLDANRVSL